MRKTRILGIAPYAGIKTLMEQVAENRKDVQLTVFVGDLETGAAVAEKYASDGYDVIISRGGTAELIEKTSSIPVVEIPLSVYDILRSIKLAENCTDKYAIIGFPGITRNAHIICDLLRYNIDIYTIHTEQDAGSTLKRLKSAGYNMVLCDMITNSLAKAYGVPNILITSGAESIEAAFDQAVHTDATYRKLNNDVNFYKTILDVQQHHVLVYNCNKELIYFSKSYTFPPAILKKMVDNIPVIMEENQKRIYCEGSGLLFVLNGFCRIINEQPCIIYEINMRKVPLALTKNGIHYLGKEEAVDSSFIGLYGITLASGMSIDQYAQSEQPLMILGEQGTGKDHMARLLYARSRLRNRPLAIIDCARLHDKGWEFLVGHDNSPLSDTDSTIYIKNIDILPEQRFRELITIIKDLHLAQQNRLLMTYSYREERGIDERCEYIVNMLSCLTMQISPLREHLQEVPNLASLCISEFNLQMAKEIIGFDPEALAVLTAYDWPCNYDQFRRIINELISMTNTPYISLESVNKLLKREMAQTAPARPTCNNLDLSQTLEQINLEILELAMAEEHGNQSAVARRLGIGRTTLWRMLQKFSSPDTTPKSTPTV